MSIFASTLPFMSVSDFNQEIQEKKTFYGYNKLIIFEKKNKDINSIQSFVHEKMIGFLFDFGSHSMNRKKPIKIVTSNTIPFFIYLSCYQIFSCNQILKEYWDLVAIAK